MGIAIMYGVSIVRFYQTAIETRMLKNLRKRVVTRKERRATCFGFFGLVDGISERGCD